MSECKNHEMTGSIDCMEEACCQSYVDTDLKDAWDRAEKAEAKNKKFERYISFMVVSCPECGYERSSYSTPPSFNCSQCGCELEGES